MCKSSPCVCYFHIRFLHIILAFVLAQQELRKCLPCLLSLTAVKFRASHSFLIIHSQSFRHSLKGWLCIFMHWWTVLLLMWISYREPNAGAESVVTVSIKDRSQWFCWIYLQCTCGKCTCTCTCHSTFVHNNKQQLAVDMSQIQIPWKTNLSGLHCGSKVNSHPWFMADFDKALHFGEIYKTLIV